MNLSTGNMNVIEARARLGVLRRELDGKGAEKAIMALNCAIKVFDRLITDAAIKNVVF